MPEDYTPYLNILLPYDGQQNAVTTIAEAITTLDAAAGPHSPRPQGIFTHTANQSIANATLTAVAFDTETYKSGVTHSTVTNNSRVVLPRLGLWDVRGQGIWALGAGGTHQLQIRVNGDDTKRPGVGPNTPGSATDAPVSIVSTLVRVTAITDYVEMMAYQTSGGARNLLQNAAPVSPKLEVVWLSD